MSKKLQYLHGEINKLLCSNNTSTRFGITNYLKLVNRFQSCNTRDNNPTCKMNALRLTIRLDVAKTIETFCLNVTVQHLTRSNDTLFSLDKINHLTPSQLRLS